MPLSIAEPITSKIATTANMNSTGCPSNSPTSAFVKTCMPENANTVDTISLVDKTR